jgi:hypothetical protein
MADGRDAGVLKLLKGRKQGTALYPSHPCFKDNNKGNNIGEEEDEEAKEEEEDQDVSCTDFVLPILCSLCLKYV